METPLPRDVKDFTLEIARRYVARKLPDYSMNTDRMHLEIRDMVEEMAKTLVLCEDLPIEPLEEFSTEVVFQVPSSWFQMLKKEHAPLWFLKRYPIKYDSIRRKVKVKMSAAYPKLPIAFPKYGGYRFHYSHLVE